MKYGAGMEQKQFKIDIFATLDAANMSKFNYYDQLSMDQKKAFAWIPFIRWFSSIKTNDPELRRYYTIKVNELLNVGVSNGMIFDLSDSPEILWGLTAAIGPGIKVPHKWIGKHKSNTTSTPKLDELILRNSPSRNQLELNLYKRLLNEDTVREFGKNYGFTDKEIKELVKEWKLSIATTFKAST